MLNEKYGINHISYFIFWSTRKSDEKKLKIFLIIIQLVKKISFLLKENNIKKIFII